MKNHKETMLCGRELLPHTPRLFQSTTAQIQLLLHRPCTVKESNISWHTGWFGKQLSPHNIHWCHTECHCCHTKTATLYTSGSPGCATLKCLNILLLSVNSLAHKLHLMFSLLFGFCRQVSSWFFTAFTLL